MDYKVIFKGIVKDLGMNGRVFSEMFGIDYSYYRKVTQRKGKGYVNWVRMFVVGYEFGRMNCGCEKKSDPSGVDVKGKE